MFLAEIQLLVKGTWLMDTGIRRYDDSTLAEVSQYRLNSFERVLILNLFTPDLYYPPNLMFILIADTSVPSHIVVRNKKQPSFRHASSRNPAFFC